MADFNEILKRGKKMFNMKDEGGVWERCEECGCRRFCYYFKDNENETWILCEECAAFCINDN